MHQTRVQAGRDNITLAGTEIHFHQAGDKEPFSPLHQLPSPPANFTGRDEELAELEKELTAAHKSGATISGKHAGLQGMGGVGKTALATVLAHKLKDHYPDAQLYLNLRGADPEHRAPVTPADAMQSIIHAFQPEAKLPEELDKLTPIYNGVLNEAGRVLLFLDNAADGEQVKPLVPPANCLLLITSRSHFSLPGMMTRDIDCLRPEKSQELLRKLAPRINGYEKDAAELCGHLPLALEVFAGVVNEKNTYLVPDLLERLWRQPAQLTKAEAAFQVSHDLLAEDLRQRWTALAVFPASFDLRAAAAVWEKVAQERTPALLADSVHDAMQALVNASLVEWNEANARYRLHDLVRQFCHGKLTEAERIALHLAHARHYTAVGDEAAKLYLTKGKHVDGLVLFDRERVQMEVAYAWLDGQVGRVTLCAPDTSKAMSQRLAEDCPPITLEAAARQMIALVNAVAYTSELRFHPRQRIAWMESQLRAARIVNDSKNEVFAIGNLGLAHAALGNARKAIELYEQSLAVARDTGNPRGEGNALGNLGVAHASLGDERKAIEYYEQALVIDREIGDRRGEGSDLGNLGIAYKNLGDARKAVEFYEQQLVIVREIGDRRGEGNALGNLGLAHARLGDARKAIEYHEQALVIDREIGDRLGEGQDLGNLGNAHVRLGDARKAIEYYEQALVIDREIGDRCGEGNDLWNSALAHDSLGNRADAIARAEASLKIREAIEDPNAAKVRARLAAWRGRA